ncbi:MAG: alpha/beta hydrolase [bacterium]|nr:alpha/beta hydrolase [bacterium]
MRFTALLLTICLSAAFADGNVTLKLWPDGAPGETGAIGPEREVPPREGRKKIIRLTDVSEPSITLYPAPAGKATGTAVLIAPGGAYNILAWDLEGTEIAEWLNSIGVTAVILKYRVPRRDKDSPHEAPLQDAQRAMRLIRQNATEWKINPGRIGMLGFSAGGNLTVMAGTHYDRDTYPELDGADKLSSRPDFLVPIYAAYLGDKQDPYNLSPFVRVTENTPPTFMAVTLDDADRGAQAAVLLVELHKHDIPAELHVFTKGGHGYGLRPSEDPVSGWPKLCEQWLRARGLIDRH